MHLVRGGDEWRTIMYKVMLDISWTAEKLLCFQFFLNNSYIYTCFFLICVPLIATPGCGPARGPPPTPTVTLFFHLADQTRLSARARCTAVCQHMQSEAVFSAARVGPAQTRIAWLRTVSSTRVLPGSDREQNNNINSSVTSSAHSQYFPRPFHWKSSSRRKLVIIVWTYGYVKLPFVTIFDVLQALHGWSLCVNGTYFTRFKLEFRIFLKKICSYYCISCKKLLRELFVICLVALCWLFMDAVTSFTEGRESYNTN